MSKRPSSARSKKRAVKEEDSWEFEKFLEYDKDGNLKLLPLKNFPLAKKKSPTPLESVTKPKVEFARLDLQKILKDALAEPLPDLGAPPNKKVKVEIPARKNLFKVPKPVPKPRTSIKGKENKPKLKNKYSISTISGQNEEGINPLEKSYLSPINENTASSVTINQFLLRPKVTPSKLKKRTISFSPKVTPSTYLTPLKKTPKSLPKIILNDDDQSPVGVDSEFLHMERICESANTQQSPFSDMCNLFQKTALTEKKNEDNTRDNSINNNNNNDIVNKIKDLLDEDKKESEDYRIRHEKRMVEIKNLVELLGNSSNKSACSPLRRSLRLSKKCISPTTTSKENDLRKVALTNNIQKRILSTPTINKAINMYNNLRKDCTFLATPRMDKTLVDSLESPTRTISKKLQAQCLLLQATPMHK